VLEQGLTLCRASGNRHWLSRIAASLGSAFALRGRLAERRRLLEEALSESRRMGVLYGQVGRREEAHVALSTAIALYRSMDMTFWLPQAEAALAWVEVHDVCSCHSAPMISWACDDREADAGVLPTTS
jgi:hypothetical protein